MHVWYQFTVKNPIKEYSRYCYFVINKNKITPPSSCQVLNLQVSCLGLQRVEIMHTQVFFFFSLWFLDEFSLLGIFFLFVCFICKLYLFLFLFLFFLNFYFIFPVAVAGSSAKTLARKASSGSAPWKGEQDQKSSLCTRATRSSSLQKESILPTREDLGAITLENSGSVDGHLRTSSEGLGPFFHGGNRLISNDAVCS